MNFLKTFVVMANMIECTEIFIKKHENNTNHENQRNTNKDNTSNKKPQFNLAPKLTFFLSSLVMHKWIFWQKMLKKHIIWRKLMKFLTFFFNFFHSN